MAHKNQAHIRFFLFYQFGSSSKGCCFRRFTNILFVVKKALLIKNQNGMNRKEFLAYFQGTEKSSSVNNDDVNVTKYVKSETGHASNAELNLGENEIIKSYQKKQEYKRNFPKMSNSKSVNMC